MGRLPACATAKRETLLGRERGSSISKWWKEGIDQFKVHRASSNPKKKDSAVEEKEHDGNGKKPKKNGWGKAEAILGREEGRKQGITWNAATSVPGGDREAQTTKDLHSLRKSEEKKNKGSLLRSST